MNAQVRALARLVDAGVRQIPEDVEFGYIVDVYVELITNRRYGWTMEDVVPEWQVDVQAKLPQ